jgi:hypothetical protein
MLGGEVDRTDDLPGQDGPGLAQAECLLVDQGPSTSSIRDIPDHDAEYLRNESPE